MTLELTQTVAVGPFNPHIIAPEWLVQQKVLPEDQEFNLRLALVVDGGAFRSEEHEWIVDSRCLIVSSPSLADDHDHDVGYYVNKVLHLLPHTPVRAVGNNFNFAGSLEDWGDSPMPMLGGHRFENLNDVDEVRWTGLFRRNGAQVQLTTGRNQTGVVVLFNFHRITQDIHEAQAATEQFRADFEMSRTMLRELLRQEVTND